VQFSNDLTTWTDQDEIYGFGNEFVVPMRQFTAPPVPEPGAPSLPQPNPTPRMNASIRMEGYSGALGGTVVSWASLDHGGAVVVRIAGEMAPEWLQVPLYSESFGAFSFFVWHPGSVDAAPEDNPVLGTNDSAMLAVLEASLPTMNEQMVNSVARARNVPAPAAPDPDSKRFWRVFVNPDIDTDSDGTPDWSEFEIAAAAQASPPDGGGGSSASGNAFNADTNRDGIPDGQQLDTDRDGICDVFDIAAEDDTAVFPFGPLPRYALFPITNAQPQVQMVPFQISDKGTVLYKNGTWTGGVWTNLDLPADELTIPHYGARAINDHNVILGISTLYLSDASGIDEPSAYCSWASPSATRSFVTTGTGDHQVYATIEHGLSGNFFRFHPYPGPILSNDGRFSAFTWGKNLENSWHNRRTLYPAYWKLAGPGVAATQEQSDHLLYHNQEPGLRWGGGYPMYDPEGRGYNTDEDLTQPYTSLIYAPNLLPEPPFTPTNVIPQSGGPILALPWVGTNAQTQAFIQGSWKTSPTFAKALDIAASGTAIGRNHDGLKAPVLLNGKWTDIGRYAPGLPAEWASINTTLLDTTPGGWILAERRNPTTFDDVGVMLPLRVDGVDNSASPANLEDPAAGVDPTSMAALGGTGRVPEIWIMAPVGGSNTVRFRTPLNPVSTLKLQ